MNTNSCTQEEMETRAEYEFSLRRKADDINKMMAVEMIRCSAEERSLTLRHEVQPWELNPTGTMHGALITYVLDAVMAVASRAYTGFHTSPTLDIHVNFLRAVHTGEIVFAKATVIHSGGKINSVRGELWTKSKDQLCAEAFANYYCIK